MSSKFKHPPRGVEVRPDFKIKDNTTDRKQGLLSQYGIIGAAKLLFKKQMTNLIIKKYKHPQPK